MSDTLEKFYEEVDAAVRMLVESGAWRLRCEMGCSGCCVDGLTVFEVEADNIQNHHEQLLVNGSPHPEGGCAFLGDDGTCRIYEHRPYVCRTQGLPLRWIEDDPEGEAL
ncbi:MAG: YkgJ family cysteine cluster protein [Syntrophobacteraceae bacterium]